MSMEPNLGTVARDAPTVLPFLSGVEWSAVLVALKDAERGRGPRSVGGGTLARVWSMLTGIEPPRPLADPRLDALRRFVMTVRGHGERIAEMMPEMRSRGFSREQVEALARVVG